MMSPNRLLGYLDHNVLDSMLKGDPSDILELLAQTNLTPVYSSENLAEIYRSKGRENSFLSLLDDINALHIVPILDSNFLQTGKFELREDSAIEAYKDYLKAPPATSNVGQFFTQFLGKMYGGQKASSYKDIFSSGADELKKLFSEMEGQLDNLSGVSQEDIEKIRLAIKDLPDLMSEGFNSAALSLDREEDVGVRQLDKLFGVGPAVLNNIDQPDVIPKIWRIIEPLFEGDSWDIETFFGIRPSSYESRPDREKVLIEKVNAVYHQLNFVGYYRDSKMHKAPRLNASLSDMTHAGLASFCHILFSRDENLVKKAGAAYEYLGVKTKIFYLKPNI